MNPDAYVCTAEGLNESGRSYLAAVSKELKTLKLKRISLKQDSLQYWSNMTFKIKNGT